MGSYFLLAISQPSGLMDIKAGRISKGMIALSRGSSRGSFQGFQGEIDSELVRGEGILGGFKPEIHSSVRRHSFLRERR